MKLPYFEGSVFCLPLRDTGFARGVVARATKRGKVLFAYFFGPRLRSKEVVKLDDLHPENAIFCSKFGDLGLINGEWTMHGKVPEWNRAEWPMPDFVTRDPLGFLKPRLVRYSDIDLFRTEAAYWIDDDRGLPTDSVAGSGAVERRMTNLLKAAPNDRN
ncbi:MAG: immunity 26/phosphotriesterase HocA family protein [Hyphomicrobiales bacterium]|nr:immunity 26/phosphotriesterase HocA family protein [Hyphomicrobiales bacterium]